MTPNEYLKEHANESLLNPQVREEIAYLNSLYGEDVVRATFNSPSARLRRLRNLVIDILIWLKPTLILLAILLFINVIWQR